MGDEPENLVLAHLRAIRTDITDMRNGQAEMLVRLNDVARQIAGLRRDLAGDAETVAHLQAQMDQVREEIARIKRRLDLNDA